MAVQDSVLIIGAGPAGLTAGYLLSRAGRSVDILEADSDAVGGLARTVSYRGFLFDIGGHRFFSKSREIEDLWTEMLPDGFLERPRSSRIYYRGKFFAYPLRASEAFWKLGPLESLRCAASYVRARLFPHPDPRTFRQWVTNQFGARLFEIFFRTYTEKVWGMSCDEISADWAAQRIRGLSLWQAVKHALPLRGARTDRSRVVKTLIDRFRYPRRGPGMLWEQCARSIQKAGGRIHRGHRAVGLSLHPPSGVWTIETQRADGSSAIFHARHVICSAAIVDLVEMLRPVLPASAYEAGRALRYRDFLMVGLIVRAADAFRDNWIYIHDPSVRVGRVQNFRSWSAEMVPDPDRAGYGLEYFCAEGDEMWSRSDSELLALARRELATIGLAREVDVEDGCVIRQRKAYPVYDHDYARHVATVREALAAELPGLHLVGRNGMHKYNNQDHAMMTAMLTVRQLLGQGRYDTWAVNSDAEYGEESVAPIEERLVPRRLGE